MQILDVSLIRCTKSQLYFLTIFLLIACCPILNILLENDVKDQQGNYEGIYTFQGFSNGMDYWVDTEGENAIWYNTQGSSYDWAIGDLEDLGTYTVAMYSSSNILEKKCPNNEGYVWNWNYGDGSSFIATNYVYIKCANEDDFCTYMNPCGADQGDCDTHDECQDGLFCGSNNCPDYLAFHSEFDCCYAPAVGNEHFCTTANPCGQDQGDCDAHDECQGSLICGSVNCPTSLDFDPDTDCCYDNSQSVVGDEDFCTTVNPCGQNEGDCDSHDECHTGLGCGLNNCPDALGFNTGVDCCFPCSGTCVNPVYKGDNYCDDENNNCGCDWDGGDCCGINVNTDYCSSCLCLDPNAASSKKSQSFDPSISISNNKRKSAYKHGMQKPLRYSNSKLSKMSTYRQYPHDLDHKMDTGMFFYSSLHKHSKKRKSHNTLVTSKARLRKSSATKSSSPTQLRKSHHANANFGLTVVLNPKAAEYRNALMSSFTGFKTLVHTPYDFAEVDAIGMAIDQNIQSYIGIRGYHSWTTDAANDLDLKQKRCLARTDDLTKYHDIRLNIFANYTKKGCILECHANLYYDMCGCLPYHYPDFTKAWHVNSTTCDYNGLRCLSTVKGK